VITLADNPLDGEQLRGADAVIIGSIAARATLKLLDFSISRRSSAAGAVAVNSSLFRMTPAPVQPGLPVECDVVAWQGKKQLFNCVRDYSSQPCDVQRSSWPQVGEFNVTLPITVDPAYFGYERCYLPVKTYPVCGNGTEPCGDSAAMVNASFADACPDVAIKPDGSGDNPCMNNNTRNTVGR